MKTQPKVELEPLNKPEFNIRQVLKEMVLLEQHLAVPSMRCDDCIKKHLITIEALTDEAYTLGPSVSTEKVLTEIRRLVVSLSHKYTSEQSDLREIGQYIRSIRKELITPYFTITTEENA